MAIQWAQMGVGCVALPSLHLRHRSTQLQFRIVVSLGPYGSYGKLHLQCVKTELN